jgi:hypothetical protein
VSKKDPLRTYLVPVRLVLEGSIQVSARSPEEAREAANDLASYDGDFLGNASYVDWGPEGFPREVK